MKESRIYLEHIVESIEKIERFIKGLSRTEFCVDYRLVWQIVKKDLPRLRKAVEKIMS